MAIPALIALTDQEYLQLLNNAEQPLRIWEQACDRLSKSLEAMGVKDVKISRDGDTWNSIPVEKRAESFVKILGGYIDGNTTPMDKLGDA